jgi:hypothetical protein
MPTFHRPWRQVESLCIPLHLTLNSYHRPSRFQPADAHASLHISCKHLILKSRNRVLECLTLMFEAAIPVDFGDQRSITDLTECLVYAIVPHIVSL